MTTIEHAQALKWIEEKWWDVLHLRPEGKEFSMYLLQRDVVLTVEDSKFDKPLFAPIVKGLVESYCILKQDHEEKDVRRFVPTWRTFKGLAPEIHIVEPYSGHVMDRLRPPRGGWLDRESSEIPVKVDLSDSMERLKTFECAKLETPEDSALISDGMETTSTLATPPSEPRIPAVSSGRLEIVRQSVPDRTPVKPRRGQKPKGRRPSSKPNVNVNMDGEYVLIGGDGTYFSDGELDIRDEMLFVEARRTLGQGAAL